MDRITALLRISDRISRGIKMLLHRVTKGQTKPMEPRSDGMKTVQAIRTMWEIPGIKHRIQACGATTALLKETGTVMAPGQAAPTGVEKGVSDNDDI